MNTLQAQNDAFRQRLLRTPTDKAGKCVITRGIAALPTDKKAQVLTAVRNDTNFTEDNDPHQEHDFGVIELPNIPKVFWKIDYFSDDQMQWGAENPAESCYRLLTIMLADEY